MDCGSARARARTHTHTHTHTHTVITVRVTLVPLRPIEQQQLAARCIYAALHKDMYGEFLNLRDSAPCSEPVACIN